jgi:hypothetical protein
MLVVLIIILFYVPFDLQLMLNTCHVRVFMQCLQSGFLQQPLSLSLTRQIKAGSICAISQYIFKYVFQSDLISKANCDWICDKVCNEFGHTLSCSFSRTEAGLLNKCSYFRCDQFTNMRDMILVTLCCVTQVRLRCSVKLLVREENFEIYKVMQIQQFSPAN